MEAMQEHEVTNLLKNARFGHLGLAKNGRAYVLPIVYGFDGASVYFHMARGLKIDYIEATEEACFQVDAVRDTDEWGSVIAFGELHVVTDERERLVAMDALLSAPLPPEWGFSETGEPARGEPQLFYRLEITHITGRKSAHTIPELGAGEIYI